ncbi:CDP-alcohol phosphatidyltransferase family protein [Clostridium sp. 19966]|uniref:CDP-alcohol phosphatidyltransferase family protein n=1 Tax=Clostridium sp. 19966 TaxID=2768166 RepID=UPI0028DDB596|nr:CDP-alcohol phosphatidyltransferase family protein [Clostridium sp. 19966]MDT8718454.1 CDP-alcohol phosphatidyltransferase family protein [Clostridium sp. 19966]
MGNLPNLITITRILGTMVLLFIRPFSGLFFIIYILSGISDVLDGMIARKMNLVSKKGQILDSIADFFMIILLLFVFVLNLSLPLWGIYWVVSIAAIRFTSLGVGVMRYRQLAFLHTYANKLTGVALFCFPFLYVGLGPNTTTILLCFIASISAIEELIINAVSKKLWRDIKSVFSL